ncbi:MULTISPECIES: heavy-metal-associated domain-containing protein [Nocardia]|uniref:Heavy-metal-associated domain-containing protein n=2 Tax=Nocardia TaxID=1817 RepID=A0A846XHS8_9NOCA|nr:MULTISPECIES: heavy metal-associated domain-containing protein [Nocardia]MBF6456080.1 heavy-metal-associated domain-containing protein [Nocardia cyriacigeorgica]MBF6477230.1 heavy-metal-associated domain-containing protein [Nocardia cyriacigeorgica]MBF6553180.1 heavy-metal-associated domain-containing protein [Nocardia cyriacigeorgica]NKY34905.1 heavy-metal-associated domain-containing protein [Nocardia speluncae]TLF77715.1 heavy-metal-associated domain-containing protein [Nocardia cyriacig
MSTSIITVAGMTCGGCASKVRTELGALDGVSRVDADPATGRVTVESSQEVDPDAVKNAVETAGYRVVT